MKQQQSSGKNYDNLLIAGGLAVGGYFLILKPLLEKLGLKKDPEVVATEQKNNGRLLNWVTDAVKAQPVTKSEQEWKIIADQIWEDLHYSSLDDNKEDAVYQVCRVKNDADFAVLFKMFAKRQEYAFGIKVGNLKNLAQFINSNLNSKQIARIHDNYKRRGIKFRF